MRHCKHLRALFAFITFSLIFVGFNTKGETTAENTKRFEKDGLVFDFTANWELSDHSNAAAQQLVLTESTLDAQIMIVALHGALTSAKQEEEAKAALIEPGISRVLKQYENSGIKVSRSPLQIELFGAPAEGAQLQFEIDRNAGTTEICWGVIGKRLVQLFFIRPNKTSAETGVCWNLIRTSLRVAGDKRR